MTPTLSAEEARNLAAKIARNPNGYNEASVAVAEFVLSTEAGKAEPLPMTERERRLVNAAREAQRLIVLAFNRVHSLPRTTDTELARALGEANRGFQEAVAAYAEPGEGG